MTDKETLREALIEVIHEGLGGNGWAYSNYGDDELNHMRNELGRAADAAIATMFERLRTPSEDMARRLNAACDTPDADLAWVFPVIATAFQQENSDER